MTKDDVTRGCHCQSCNGHKGCLIELTHDTVAMWCQNKKCPMYLNAKDEASFLKSKSKQA